MKTLFIILSLTIFSVSAIANEIICEPGHDAGPYSTLRIQIMGLIPLHNEYKNNHLMKISNTLIPYLKELCATGATSEEITFKMLGKCKETAKVIVAKKELNAYYDNCDLGYALANAYVNGAKSQADKCENKDAVSELGRTTQKAIMKDEASNIGNATSK